MTGEVQATDLAARLRRSVQGTVSYGARRRAEYSSDAGNYRVLPLVVVEPMDVDDVLAILDVSRDLGVPVVGRGGGTSIAGNAIGPGIVIDFARHLSRIVEIDSSSRTALVQPGVILSDLQRQAAPFGLRFGPDPSSQNRASIGGMIGNNACGPHAVAYGRTADNVRALTVVDGQGRLIRTAAGPQRVPELGALVDAHLEVIRTEFGRFPRQISGYSLEHLLPERGRDLAKALVGSEGTLALTLDATIALVPISPAQLLVVLGYPDMASAADAVPAVLAHAPLAVEGLDARLVDVVRIAKGSAAVPELPQGRRLADGRGRRHHPRRGEIVGAVDGPGCRSLGSCGVGTRPGGDGAVADSGRRGRSGRPNSGRPAGLARLGGRRGAAGPTRWVPARVRGIDDGIRGGRTALRPLR